MKGDFSIIKLSGLGVIPQNYNKHQTKLKRKVSLYGFGCQKVCPTVPLGRPFDTRIPYGKKSHLKNKWLRCIIYSESLSDTGSDLPSVKNVMKK